MPKWVVHNKWAQLCGIPADIADFVNGLVDRPDECKEFLEFFKSDPVIPYIVRHDDRRTRDYQLDFLRQRGPSYVRAWYLHHGLDYLAWWVSNMPPEHLVADDILDPERLRRKNIGDPQDDPELQHVVDFVRRHFDDITRDLASDGKAMGAAGAESGK